MNSDHQAQVSGCAATAAMPDLPESAKASVSLVERIRVEYDFLDHFALDRSWRVTGFGPLDPEGDRQYLEAERLAATPAAATPSESDLRASHERLKEALKRIEAFYSDELSRSELAMRMYDAGCIARAALEAAP